MKGRTTNIAAWAFPAATLALVAGMLITDGGGEVGPTIVAAAVPLSFAFTGAVIASRRPKNRIGWIFCVFSLSIPAEVLVTYGAENGTRGTAMTWLAWAFTWTWAPLLGSLITYLPLTFPDGRIIGRTRRAILAVAALGVGMIVIGTALEPGHTFGQLSNPLAIAGHDALFDKLTNVGVIPVGIAALASMASAVQRYRRARGTERQQLKWFAFAMSVAIAGALGQAVLYEVGKDALGQIVFGAGFVWLPVALGLAILRYQLFDIDRIISRSVGWAIVSVVIGGLYLVAVTVLSSATAGVAGESSVAVAASTLVAAAAFGPVRHRVQGAVDRPFNRARYDAERTVATYRTHLRDDLDVDSITADLQRAVGATLQPRAAVLWLRQPGGAQ